jgi:TetR/AcrR family transcriptional regulator, cholesterol catabolism regulator
MARLKKSKKVRIQEETREKFLEAAAREFADAGYQAGNVNHISTAAGFARGTIYNYFPSKEALMQALITRIARLQLNFIRKAVLAESEPEARLTTFFRAGFDFVTAYPDHARVAVNTVFGPEMDLKMHEYQAYQPLFELLAREILAKGVESGAFRPMDVEKMTLTLMMLYLAGNSPQTETGLPWMDPETLGDFTLHGILK